MADIRVEKSVQIETLAEKIARLEKEIADKDARLQLSEQQLLKKDEQLAAQLLAGTTVQEVACGTRDIEMRDRRGFVLTKRQPKLDGEGKHELDEDGKPMYEKVSMMKTVPVFKYRIDLPASGGIAISINGFEFYHGQAYDFTEDELRTIKDMVARSWNHEANIMGKSNENAYRQPTERRLSMAGGRPSIR